MYDQEVTAREATQSSQSGGGELESRVRAETKRVLTSRAFRQVDSLKRLLSFLVDETLAGRGEQLKEIVVGLEVFAKDGAFNPRNDPIVRVQARHLRTRLARYYREEGKSDELQ